MIFISKLILNIKKIKNKISFIKIIIFIYISKYKN